MWYCGWILIGQISGGGAVDPKKTKEDNVKFGNLGGIDFFA
jgi:hypothetical protein